MIENPLISIRNILINNSSITSKVSSSSIVISYPNRELTYPCIVILNVSDDSKYYIGSIEDQDEHPYKYDTLIIQFDIKSKNSLKDVIEISDILESIFDNEVSGFFGVVKAGGLPPLYDDTENVFVRSIRFMFKVEISK